MGWVTPLGTGLDEVWSRLQSGERAVTTTLTSPLSDRTHPGILVPPELVEAVGIKPRLRRSGAISYFTASAALAALENAGIKMSPEVAERTAIVFAIASGGVVYTRKFYETIVKEGAGAASPLLFPETVYNAPASHVAALLGITEMSYTLVGDSAVGIAALKFAEQLLETSDIDRCLVVGGEEIDWVLCEAYAEWRFPFVLAEGAAAVVLGRTGNVALDAIHEGVPFFNRKDASGAILRACADLAKYGGADLAVGGANGSWLDANEQTALAEHFPGARMFLPKLAIGEALGAGALIQTVCGALALEKQRLKSVLVTCPGLNHQASGLRMTNDQ